MHTTFTNLVYGGFDFCALVLGIIVIINYFLSKRINNRTSFLYRALTLCAIGSTIINELAIIAISVTGCPLWLNYFLTAVNYIAYNATGIIYLMYAFSVIYENKRLPKLAYCVSIVLSATTVVGLVLACISLYNVNGTGISRVVYEGIIYGSQFAALLISLVFTAVNRRRLRPMQRVNVYFFTVLNMIAVLVQYFLTRIQVCNFALICAILVIYITLQRPEDAIDEVSGLFNQKTFNRRVSTLIKSETQFSVFVMEVNNMSIVNSTFGLHGGNQIIREVSRRLQIIADKNLYVYRLSGIRFAIVFNTDEEYQRFAQSYASMFDQVFVVGETELHLTATACIIAVPEITDRVAEFEDLIKYYRSSVKVSDTIIVADRDAIEKTRRRELVDYAIQNAITNNLFEVYYQPIYSLKEKRFNSCEALIRLRDPDLGFISPDEFIPIAEQNGRIVEVGRFVTEEVCRFIKEYNPSQYGLDCIDVNLSVMQCMHPEIINDIEETLKKYSVPRSMINLEVTETASAKSYALLQSRLNELHSNGFSISLDDFGTGFSSVEYLINFPFDIVKLDKSLVWAYMSTKKYEPILQHYMPMLHSLGTKIVAEGVETIEMVNALDELGCDYLQGYYYSRPIPKEAFIEFIKRNYEVKTA
jgi:EAL domain-containing protein (putative c-di-GMP-specific phosphodiesterase class I)/GGDEF domain-containing protein